jgi:hypothetical protein
MIIAVGSEKQRERESLNVINYLRIGTKKNKKQKGIFIFGDVVSPNKRRERIRQPSAE